MDMTGEHQIAAPRAAVWAGLNDPVILKRSILGCEELTKASDTEFQAQVTAKVGPVKAKFNGKVTLSDLDPPNGYTISGEGSGGAAGFAKGGAKVHLEDAGSGTLLKYEVHAQIGGKLAQIGSRLVDGAARKMADDFFTAFAAAVESQSAIGAVAPSASDRPAGAAVAAAPVALAPAVPPPAARRSPVPWIVSGVVVVGAALWWFSGR
jgi:carbon monoxide dehydrogenase subunit G